MSGPTHKLADGTRVFPEGYDPADLTLLTAVDYLDDAKRELSAQVEALRDQHTYGGMTIAGVGSVQTDEKSLTKIGGQVQRAQLLGSSFSDNWRMEDNSLVPVDSTTMIQIGLAVGQFVSDCQARKNTLDEAIDAAATLADLEAIDIASGWPA